MSSMANDVMMADAEIDIAMQQMAASADHQPSLWVMVAVACIFLIFMLNKGRNSGRE